MTFAFVAVAVIALLLAGTLFKQLLDRARCAEFEVDTLRAQRDASLYSELQGRSVVILTTERQSYRGVLAQSYVDGHRLVSPELIQDAQPAALDGEIFIDRAKVALIQIPEPTATRA